MDNKVDLSKSVMITNDRPLSPACAFFEVGYHARNSFILWHVGAVPHFSVYLGSSSYLSRQGPNHLLVTNHIRVHSESLATRER